MRVLSLPVLLVVLSVMTAFGAEFERPKAKPKAPERQRLPGEYSVARIGMLPVTAEKGRALMYTEQYLAFDGDSEKLAEAEAAEARAASAEQRATAQVGETQREAEELRAALEAAEALQQRRIHVHWHVLKVRS